MTRMVDINGTPVKAIFKFTYLQCEVSITHVGTHPETCVWDREGKLVFSDMYADMDDVIHFIDQMEVPR